MKYKRHTEIGGLSEDQNALVALLVDDEAPETPEQQPIQPDPDGRYESFPLTLMQQAYLIGRDASFDLGNVSSHVYIECDTGVLDPERYQSAWRMLIDRHPMLRTLVYSTGYQQTLKQTPPFELKILDLRQMPAAETEQALASLRNEMSHQVFASDRWPLFDVRFTFIDETRARLHFSLDGLIADGISFPIMMREVALFYENPEASLSPLDLSFRDCVLFMASLKETNAYRNARDYWMARIPQLPPAPDLPMSKSHTDIVNPQFRRLEATLDPDRWERLKKHAAEAGITPTVVLIAAFADVLRLWSRGPSFCLNLTTYNRFLPHPQINDIIGDFTALLILEVSGAEHASFVERATRLQDQLLADMSHREFDGLEVMREMARAQVNRKQALMPVVFTSNLFIGDTRKDMTIGGHPIETSFAISQTPQVLLDHQIYEKDGALGLVWDVVEEAFPPGLMDEMFAACRDLALRLADDETSWHRKAVVPLPESQARNRIEVNKTDSPISADMLHTLFEETALRQPEQTAVITSKTTMSYEAVWARSRQIAHLLRSAGARPNKLVAVVMEKGWEQVVGVLGIHKSGAAYLPIDPQVPPERLAHILADGDVAIVLTQSWLENRIKWPQDIALFFVDTLTLDPHPAGEEDFVRQPESLAYVIYTSGSTGKPKGVAIDHRGAVNTVRDINGRFEVGPADRVLALSNLNFDLSVYDIYGMLAAGGAIVLPDADKTKNPVHWAALMEKERVTLWNTVPALMRMLVEYVGTDGETGTADCLRLVLMSGDWIPVDLPGKIKRIAEKARVISLGGATEASIWSVLYPIDAVDPQWTSIPYGRPMTNQRLYILNDAMAPCPDWVPGSLYIGGIGLAQGYWRDKEKTRAAFVTHPATGERLYHTGDMGRYMPDGAIEFLGRKDSQVKIRGYRIELGEIEAILKQHASIDEAVVIPTGPSRDYQSLSAYIVTKTDTRTPDFFDIEQIDAARSESYWTALVDAGLREAGAQATEEDMDIATYVRFWEILNQLYTNAFCRSLTKTGLYTKPGETHDVNHIMASGRIVSRYRKWLERGIKALEKDGMLRRHDNGFECVNALPSEMSGELAEELTLILTGKLGYTKDQIDMIFDMADHLLDIVTENIHSAEIYASAETPKVYEKLFSPNNAVIAEIMKTVADAQNFERPLRVLELGAGVGSTTASILLLLPAEHTHYFFTDISGFFLREAKEKFAAYPFVEYGLLDLEKDPFWQGYEAHIFDVIVASSVLHVPKKIAETMHHVNTLLAPGGILIMVEETRFQPYFDLTMGLQQGFDRFEDFDLRPNHPLLSRDQWQIALADAGFERYKIIHQPGSLSDFLGFDVIIAQNSSSVKRFNGSVLDLFLKGHLPDYMVPSSYLIVDHLPLTPNGKVDRKVLCDTFSESSMPSKDDEYEAPRTELERRMAKLWKAVLEVDRIGIHDNFFELGGDSLQATTLVGRIIEEFGENADPTGIFQNIYKTPTIAHLADTMRNQSETARETHAGARTNTHLVALKSEGTAPPFFCIHDGSGDLHVYRELCNYFDSQRPLYGIRVGDQDVVLEQYPGDAIKRLASVYVDTIRSVQPEGPYLIGGHCVGGVIAFEMAQQLLEQGQKVSHLVVISSYAPPYLIEDDVFLLYLFAGILGVDRKQFGFDFEESEFNDAVLKVLRSNPVKIDQHEFYQLADDPRFDSFAKNYRKAHKMYAEKRLTEEMLIQQASTTVTSNVLGAPEQSLEQIGRFFHMEKASLTALTRYESRPYPESVILFRTTETHQYFLPDIKDKIISFWTKLVPGRVRPFDVPGTHWTCMREPHIRVLAEKLKMALADG